jgi:hypothetical protein
MKKLSAIRIKKKYAGMSRPAEHLKGTKEYINLILADMNKNPETYVQDIMQEDGLPYPPVMLVDTGKHGCVPFEPKVEVVAEVKYVYEPAEWRGPRKLGWFAKLLIIALILGVPGVIFTATTFTRMHDEATIRSMCWLYTRNGEPEEIIIGGHTYKYSNGAIDEVRDVFVNPWVREELDDPYNRCVHVRLKENNK